MVPYPEWLHILAWAYLAFCLGCAALIAFDVVQHPQKMWIMDLVWPITGLYFGLVAVWLYHRTKPVSVAGSPEPDESGKQLLKKEDPTREQISAAVFHCGAGCTLGDMTSETLLFMLGGATFLAGSEFGTKLFVDFLLAYAFGIVFQYFTIVPMRGLSLGKGILAAMRADTISILCFEIGMFAWMALSRFVFFPEPRRVHPDMAVFWFMMQIAMIVGSATAYPANLWLIKKGWKEKMPQYPSEQERHRHKLPHAA